MSWVNYLGKLLILKIKCFLSASIKVSLSVFRASPNALISWSPSPLQTILNIPLPCYINQMIYLFHKFKILINYDIEMNVFSRADRTIFT